MTSCLPVVTWLVCVIVTSLTAADDVAGPNLESFDELARRLMDCRRVPGLVAAVVDLGRTQRRCTGPPGDCPGPRGDCGGPRSDPVVVLRHYGWADVDARRPMMSNTRVCVASLTKAFTSTLLGIMLHNSTTTRQVIIIIIIITTIITMTMFMVLSS